MNIIPSKQVLKINFLPYRKHCVSIIEEKRLLQYKEIMAVYFGNHINTQCVGKIQSLINDNTCGTYSNHCAVNSIFGKIYLLFILVYCFVFLFVFVL